MENMQNMENKVGSRVPRDRGETKAMHDEFAALTAQAHAIEKRIAKNLSEVLG